MKPKRRVVITGMGVLAPNGNSVEEFWENTLACKSGIAPISAFDATAFPVKIAGEVKNFDLHNYCPEGCKCRRLARHSQFALATTIMALNHAKLTREALADHDSILIGIGVSVSAMEIVEGNHELLRTKGPNKVSPTAVLTGQPQAVSSAVMHNLGISSRLMTFSSACPSGLDALAYCARQISDGRMDVAISGGVDAPITPLSMATLRLGGLAHASLFAPEKCSRPFDLDRRGGIIAEGGCVMILESLDHALMRGATPLLEIHGYGNQADLSQHHSGQGLETTMSEALANSGFRPNDLDYICAHGPSHPVIDHVETEMIKRVLNGHAYRIPVSSIKGVIGNPMAAAGPLQVAATAMAIKQDMIPPTANYETRDPNCDLDYVPNRPYAVSINRALVNVHGLGGGNSSLVVSRVSSA